ncbi:MAG: exodeoxyribonuclease VII large subunit [Candidatus Pacebacteria bacterium]|nr:exodeoxyribonuclease VII large subunit [Candidatus Paceibacterota bacterium]
MYKETLKNIVFTVSEYIEFLNNVLLSCEAKVEGEVNQVKKSTKGHVYFSIKDNEGSILDCVIWNYYYRICGVNLEEGMHIVLSGVPSIYAGSGRLSFKASTIELIGAGALKKQYEELKKKLQKQGAFDRQMQLKEYPQTIGVITSKQGAVIHDFLNNLGKYNFKIEFIDSRVEGAEAIEDLISSIKTFKKIKIDSLVVMRGGGAKNSFDVFNNEAVIKEIINYPCPVISGLGHHEDVPLFALASDYSVSTPTAAAHLLNSSWDELIFKIDRNEQYIFERYNNLLNDIESKIEKAFQIFNIFENKLKEINEKINFFEKEVYLNDPKRQLKLGYSIARKDGKIIKSIKGINKEDLIDLEVRDGIIKSKAYGKERR